MHAGVADVLRLATIWVREQRVEGGSFCAGHCPSRWLWAAWREGRPLGFPLVVTLGAFLLAQFAGGPGPLEGARPALHLDVGQVELGGALIRRRPPFPDLAGQRVEAALVATVEFKQVLSALRALYAARVNDGAGFSDELPLGNCVVMCVVFVAMRVVCVHLCM